MQKTSFINNYSLIREENRDQDEFNFIEYIKTIQKTIDSIKKPAILGIVGKFGSGKSTILNTIKKNYNDEKWINFDAWKFPERKDLWEGFVLEFGKQINYKTFESARIIIDGEKKSDIKQLISVIARGANTFVPGAGVIENFKYFFKSSPARRVFEIQEILEKIIEEQKEDIFIIIEDIDRSGDKGIFFLETLNNFICNIKTNKKILVIVPLATENYHENIESYVKCINHFYFFNLPNPKLENFVEKIILPEFIQDQVVKKQITEFLELLFPHYKINPRMLKLILRDADATFTKQISDGWSPDFRITTMFASFKYIYENIETKQTYFEYFKKNKKINQDTIFAKFLYVINPEHPRESIYISDNNTIDSPSDFIFIPRSNEKNTTELPWWGRNEFGAVEKEIFFLTDKYINY